jgi:hypothetical protein
MKRKDEGYLEVGIPGTLGYLGHIGHARRTCELLGGGLWPLGELGQSGSFWGAGWSEEQRGDETDGA